ncbi:peptidase C39 family protein [Tissierella sp.]|uniref:peptidase C39 family protein n=1 Tax=Tissierella sp. TaxID=41274 RepID=UPI0028607824|nr:peptidase C39 family protein [Tissierella sp.]MDR7855392.1 peptidase C39 family protein [Tissierella sp.]
MFKKLIILLTGVALLLSGCNKIEISKEVSYSDGLIINRQEDFKIGEYENVKINDKSEIILEDSALYGKYISPVINTEEFEELVASWNVNTPKETEIELSIQVKIEDEWSMWFSYGKWSESQYRGSVSNQSDRMANMSIDTLEVLLEKGAHAVKYCVELTRKEPDTPSPEVRNVFLALKLIEETKKVFAEDGNYLVELDVPERTQMLIPNIGNVICSPTSLSMVLEYYGYDMDTEEVAKKVLDKEANIYGNWSFNASYAGTKGLDAYVARYTSVDDIKEKISKAIPVIASIKTKSEDILIGAPQTYPSGHLIVVRGFTVKDGEEYIIVNDPAAPELETVRREYQLSGFEKAWSKIVYILSPRLE